MTPRANFSGGSATPRSGHSYSSSGSRAQGSGDRRGQDSGSMFPPPSPAGGRPAHKSKGGALWGQVVQDNRGQERQDSRRSGGGQ